MYRFFSFDADVPEASFCKWEPEGSILISWKDLLNMLRLMFPSCLVGKFASHMKTELVMILYYLNAGVPNDVEKDVGSSRAGSQSRIEQVQWRI
ncbi:hypothetical protein V6N13_065124 [Hibiscus sabdariffa]